MPFNADVLGVILRFVYADDAPEVIRCLPLLLLLPRKIDNVVIGLLQAIYVWIKSVQSVRISEDR